MKMFQTFRKYYFLFAFFFIFVGLCIRFPTLSYDSQLWAEQGTNYLFFAVNESFIENIFKTDAGYLVALPRLVAYFTYQLFPIKYFALITNLVGLAFVSFSLSLICLNGFRTILPSDDFRFILSLILGVLLVPYYENCTYVNFSYHGIFICLIFLFYPLEGLSKGKFALLSLLIAVLCLNKIHFVLFFPVYLAWTVYFFLSDKSSNGRLKYFYFPALFAFLLQILNVVSIARTDEFISSKTAFPLDYFIVNEFKAISVYFQSFSVAAPLVLSLLLWGIAVSTSVWLWKCKTITSKQFMFHFLLNYVALGFVCISVLAHGQMVPQFRWMNNNLLFVNRVEFLTLNCIVIYISSLLYFLLNIKHSNASSLFLTFTLILMFIGPNFSLVLQQSDQFSHMHMSKFSQSDWKRYYSLLAEDRYYIPVNPMGSLSNSWYIAKNVRQGAVYLVEGGCTNIALSGETSSLYGLMYHSEAKLNITLKNNEGNIIAETSTLTKKSRIRKLVKFQKPVNNFSTVCLFDENNLLVKNPVHILLLLATDK